MDNRFFIEKNELKVNRNIPKENVQEIEKIKKVTQEKSK